MIDDALVLKVERLRDGVVELRDSIRARYGKPNRPVVAQDLRDSATQLGERWLVEIAARSDVGAAIGTDHLADLNVEFQRILTYAEQATVRRKYDSSTTAILRDFRNRIIAPLKQQRAKEPIPAATPSPPPGNGATVAFIGQSFAANDQTVNSLIQRFLEAFGMTVLTVKSPRPTRYPRRSESVSRRPLSSSEFSVAGTRLLAVQSGPQVPGSLMKRHMP